MSEPIPFPGSDPVLPKVNVKPPQDATIDPIKKQITENVMAVVEQCGPISEQAQCDITAAYFSGMMLATQLCKVESGKVGVPPAILQRKVMEMAAILGMQGEHGGQKKV